MAELCTECFNYKFGLSSRKSPCWKCKLVIEKGERRKTEYQYSINPLGLREKKAPTDERVIGVFMNTKKDIMKRRQKGLMSNSSSVNLREER